MKNKKSPFDSLYSPISNTPAYLARIGFEGTPTPSLECLKKLTIRHLLSVPFENLDVFHAALIPSLETEDLFEKIVVNRRGGYCFELNGLFLKLLSGIGFSCFSSTARIMLGCDYIAPPLHEIIWTKIDEKLYFCDVGYGGPSPTCPLEFVFDIEQTDTAGNTYRFVERDIGAVLEVKLDEKFQPMMAVNLTPCEPVDFLALNTYCATSPNAPFTSRQMLCLITENGKCTINNNLLRIKDNNKITETVIKTEDELRGILMNSFGIVYDKKLRLIE